MKAHHSARIWPAVTLMMFSGHVLAQTSPATFPDLKLSTKGSVYAMAMQEDGKVVIGGSFTSVNDEPRESLARLNPNGSVDLTWHPFVCSAVYALAVSGDDLYVGGSFVCVGGQYRRGLGKVSLIDGNADPDWDPATDDRTAVYSLLLDGTNLYVGGQFESMGGLPTTNLARVIALGPGLADPEWAPNPNGTVWCFALAQPQLYVGGSFTRIGGTQRHRLARLSVAAPGAVDPVWDPNVDLERDEPDDFHFVNNIALDGTNIFIAGRFDDVGDASRHVARHVAKISVHGDGAADPNWATYADSWVDCLALKGTNVYLAGNFSFFGGEAHEHLAKATTVGTGASDPSWNPRVSDGACRVLLASPGGSALLVGGDFGLINGDVSMALTRIDQVTGLRDQAFDAQVGIPGQIQAVARQVDGKFVVGGDFLRAGSLPRVNLARANPDGTLDTAWTPSTDSPVVALAIADTNIFVGGYFGAVSGVQRNGLAKLTTTSDRADTDWNPAQAFNGYSIRSLAVWGTNLFVGGYIRTAGALQRTNLVKLSTLGTGAIDPLWSPNPGEEVGVLAVGDTNLFVGGWFSTFRGLPLTNLVKLSVTGAGELDLAWNAQITDGTNSFFGLPGVSALAVSGTNLFVGGNFASAGGQPRSGLAKLSTTGGGSVDRSWDPAPRNAGSIIPPLIKHLAASGTNLYVAGGFFNSIGGQSRSQVAKLSTEGSGLADPSWRHDLLTAAGFLPAGEDVYVAGKMYDTAGAVHSGLYFLPIADAPVISQKSATTVTFDRSAEDGAEVTHFRITAVSGTTLFRADGVTSVQPGDFLTVAEGTAGLLFFDPATNATVTAVSALNDTPEGAGTAATTFSLNAAQWPVFSFDRPQYFAREASGSVPVKVLKRHGGAATVNFTTVAGSATAGLDFQSRSSTLSFAANETSKTVVIGIVTDFLTEGDEVFTLRLSNPSAGGAVVNPALATVTIIDTAALAEPFTTRALPAPLAPPPSSGVLTFELTPPQAGGQWQLEGELSWHESGAAVAGLVTGNYAVDFKPVPGYRQPDPLTVPIRSGATNAFLAYYTATTNLGQGSLSVRVEPDEVATNASLASRGQWHRQGELNWHDSGEAISGLNAGSHLVEFKGVSGRATPPARSVSVFPNQLNEITGTYLYTSAAPGLAPQVLPFETATTTEPYLYSGQIQSDAGFGSGVVVKERTVLTAAHVLFDDVALSYVTLARWFFQRYRGQYEPPPQAARGWYIFEGYATQRQVDHSPGVSSPESQQLDAAAMYFLEPAARGGFGGYLTSDAAPNEWLGGPALKMLVGYPLDTISETNRGRPHATPATAATFVQRQLRVYSTTDLKSYPGNSGGPLYVQVDGDKYYPAGIYLGGSAETLVRAIDSEVADLIERAERSAHGGGNSTGGGVVIWSPGNTVSPFNPGLFVVNLQPSQALGQGAAWRVAGGADPAWLSDTLARYPLIPGPFDIEFKPVPGFSAPAPRRVEVVANQTTILDAVYAPLRLLQPARLPGGEWQAVLTGATGRVYTIQVSADLSSWVTLVTLTNRTGSNFFRDSSTNLIQRFYRGREQ